MTNIQERFITLGTRFSADLYPQRLERGLRQYPVGGVISGLVPSVGAIVTGPGTSSISVTLSPGTVRLDAAVITLTAALTKVITTPVDLSLPFNQEVDIFINPTRKVVASATAPASPVNGTKWIQTADYGDYKQAVAYKVYDLATTSWKDFDPTKEPIGKGQMALPMNDILDTLTAANITNRMNVELPVYNSTGAPVYVSTPAPAKLRDSAAMLVAIATVNAGVLVSIKTPIDSTVVG